VYEEVVEPVEVERVSLLEVREDHVGRPVKLDQGEKKALEGRDEGGGVPETRGVELEKQGVVKDGC